MADLYFLLSGEHDTLPISELRAILNAEDYTYEISENLDQVVRLTADRFVCEEAVKPRAAFTRLCGLELFNCEAKTSRILKSACSADFKMVLREEESFAVRVRRVKNCAREIDRMVLERKLGRVLLKKTKTAKVDLEKPDKVFIGILTDQRFIFGMKLAEIPPKPFIDRRPIKKPFFHPSAMQAKLARCMVNLSQPKTGDLVFDPFCGTGTMLVEALLIGCRVLGSDIKRNMVKGALKNLVHFKMNPEGILVADARMVPVAKVDCVVTDPPYGRSATTMKRPAEQVVKEVLGSVHDLLDAGKRVCIAAPKRLNIRPIGMGLGYKHLESHFVYVHRSLTREVAVFERV